MKEMYLFDPRFIEDFLLYLDSNERAVISVDRSGNLPMIRIEARAEIVDQFSKDYCLDQ